MRTAYLLAPLLLLAACAAPQSFVGPSGKTAYSTYCGENLAACYKKLGPLCPSGYSVVDSSARGVLVIECK